MAWQPRISARRRPDGYKSKADRLPERKPEPTAEAQSFAASLGQRAHAHRMAQDEATAKASAKADREARTHAKTVYACLVNRCAVPLISSSPEVQLKLLMESAGALDDAEAVERTCRAAGKSLENLHADIETARAASEQQRRHHAAGLEDRFDEIRLASPSEFPGRWDGKVEALRRTTEQMLGVADLLQRYRFFEGRVVNLVEFEALKAERIAELEMEITEAERLANSHGFRSATVTEQEAIESLRTELFTLRRATVTFAPRGNRHQFAGSL